jgi:putative transposase
MPLIKMARPVQLALRFKSTWGGARAGAGRPAGSRRTVAHRQRPPHKARFPLHVTVRARGGLPPLREEQLAETIRRCIAAASDEGFRVVHFSVQKNHLHLIVEATGAGELSRGMQGLNVRVARAVNRLLGARGRVWRERYHARELETPRAVRNAIVYVLMNARKHGARIPSGVDACSSAPWFDGFRRRASSPEDASPVRAPRTWLASKGWRRRGLVGLHERPRAPG